MAESAGASLGGVVSVSEYQPEMRTLDGLNAEIGAPGAMQMMTRKSRPIRPGEMTIKAQVSVVYALK